MANIPLKLMLKFCKQKLIEKIYVKLEVIIFLRYI